jgi:ABC-type transport system substrate-binding protein
MPMKVFACLSLIVIVSVLSACANTPATPASEPGGTLRWSLEGISDVTSLDPARSVDYQSTIVRGLIFAGLVRLDDELNVVPDGAASWTVSADGTRYTFTLRENLRFGDGTPATADDVVYSLTRAIAPDSGSPFAYAYLSGIVGAAELANGAATTLAGVEALDERRVAITLTSPQAYFLAQLSYSPSFLVPRSLIESGADWPQRAFGSGPFRVQEWRRGQAIVLAANEHYWQGRPGIDRIELPFLSDANLALDLYLRGDLEVMGNLQSGVPTGRIAELRANPGLRTASAAVVRYIGFNNQRPPFDNVFVRQAFAQAIDKTGLTNQVLAGAATPAQRILPPAFPGTQLTIEPLNYDPVGSRSALGLAGYLSGASLPPIIFSFADEGDNHRVADALQTYWRDTLGIDVVIEPLPLGEFVARLDATTLDPTAPHSLQFYLSTWGADYFDPHNFLSLQLRSDSPFNNGRWANASFDELTLRADRLSGNAEAVERLRLYNQAEQIAVTEVGWLPLFYPAVNVLLSPNVSGLAFTPGGVIADDWTAVRVTISD